MKYMSRFLRSKAFSVVLALCLVSLSVGLNFRRDASRVVRDRLESVWPSLMPMPEADRAALVKSAFACGLSSRSAQTVVPPQLVLNCLRDGADSFRSTDPKTAAVVVRLVSESRRSLR